MSARSWRLNQAAALPAVVGSALQERHHRVLVSLDVVFGGYCVAIAGAAALAWWNGRGSLRTVFTLLACVVVNGVISQISRRTSRPVVAEIGRIVAGAVIAPLAYLATDAPFGMWWPGFLIMALGGGIILGLLTGSAVPGRLLALDHAGALCVTELLASPQPNWYAFSVGAGAIVMVGFLLADIVALLERALAAERHQTEALKLEKARTEQLLQKEAEAALRSSEEHFRTLIEHSSDGIAIVGRDGRIRYLSPAAAQILGRSGASSEGHEIRASLHPDDRERASAEFARQLAAPQEVRVVESRVVRPDGSVRAVEIVARGLPSGEVVGNLRDVTERRQMDRAFRAIVEGTAGATGEDFFRSLVEHLATALGVDHAFVAEVTGWPPTGARTAAFWSRGRIVANIEYGLAGTPCEGVIAGDLCMHPAGLQTAFPADRELTALGAESYLGMPLRDSAGAVLGHVAVLDNRPMRDERRRQEILSVFAARAGAELERQRAQSALMALNGELEERVRERTAALQVALDESSRLSTVLEATPDIVGMALLDGQGLYLNRAGRERLGVGLDVRADSFNISSFYTESSLQTVLNEGIPTAMKEGSWSGELVMRSLGGDEIPVSMAGIAHVDAAGAPRYISAIARDISESRRIAAELQTAKDAAEAASRSKSTFLATMSHEIRTPMNAVIGMTDLLLSTGLTPKQREFVDTIRAGGDALLGVINDILDFSKIEAGRLELESRQFDLRLALESAVELLAPRAAEKRLELALSIDPALPSAVIGDEMRLRQIVVNLAGNGIKFTDEGEVIVSVTAGAAPSNGSQTALLLSVSDTGIGIPPAKRDRLFASFSQLDPSTTREYGGTGLGLAISKRLVELMGGRIWAESEGVPGRGSVFQFTVPLGLAPADARPTPPAPGPALAGRRVLVVDDNATNRHILGLQLQRWGMLAIQAALPAEALDLVRRGDRFDLVILDMQMPGMDGLALARAVCAETGGRRLPIVMLTSIGRDLGADAEAVGCFAGHLTKPVKSSQLYDAIVTALVGPETAAGDRADGPAVLAAGARPTPAQLEILLAEDMEVNRRFALLALEELGYRADVAVNGADALQALSRRSYDLILMDVQMPEMDGLEATRRIRRDVQRDRQPYIIAMTANAMRGDREMCLEVGMDDYLSKPVYLDELRAAVERAAARITRSRLGSGWAPAVTAGAVEAGPTPGRDESDAPIVDCGRARSCGPALLELFMREADDTLQRLREAFDRGDAGGVREAAHGLKGASGYVGASRVGETSARIECTVRSGGIVDPREIERLGEEIGALRRELLIVTGAASDG